MDKLQVALTHMALAPARPQYSLTPPGPGNVTEDLVSHTGARCPYASPPRARAAHFMQIRTLLVAGPPAEVTITTCRRPPVSRLIFVLLFCCFVVLFESNQQTTNFVARQVLYVRICRINSERASSDAVCGFQVFGCVPSGELEYTRIILVVDFHLVSDTEQSK